MHVDYAGNDASVSIENGRMLAGWLPPKTIRRVRAWMKKHRAQLMEAWETAKSGRAPTKITPDKSVRSNPAVPTIRKIPRLNVVEWIGGNEVRLFFSNRKVVEIHLPWVRSTKNAKITTHGMGLDPGDGLDVSASMLARPKAIRLYGGRVLRKPSWIPWVAKSFR